jgi:hypothetical protein
LALLSWSNGINTLGFAVPSYSLLALSSVLTGACCFCDHSPWAKAFRNHERVGHFFYFNATATLPAFARIVVLGDNQRRPRKKEPTRAQ